MRASYPMLLLLLLAACEAPPPPSKELAADDYRIGHPLSVAPAQAQLRLDTGDSALNVEDRRRLQDFALNYIRRGQGSITVSAGGVGKDDLSAQNYAESIAADLLAEGVKPRELSLWLVVGDRSVGPGQALLTFQTAVALLPECGDWREASGNRSPPNFGCAMQRNVGAMLADPRDLRGPHSADVADAARGDVIMDRMSRGEGSWSYPLPLTFFNHMDATKSKGN